MSERRRESVNVTITVSRVLKEQMDEHPAVNWSSVARAGIRSFLQGKVAVRLENGVEVLRGSS